MSRRSQVARRPALDLYDRELGPPQPRRWWLEGRVTDQGLSYMTRVGATSPWWMPAHYRQPEPAHHQGIGTDDTAGWLAHIWEEPDLADRARRLVDNRARPKKRP